MTALSPPPGLRRLLARGEAPRRPSVRRRPSPPARPLALYVAGVGHVGRALLRQIEALGPGRLRIVGACTSRTSAVDAGGGLVVAPVPPDWPAIVRRLAGAPAAAFVDVTGHPDVAALYPVLLRAGVHVVTASKLAPAGTSAQVRAVHAAARAGGAAFRHEATAGAGLPLVGTLLGLAATGDRVHRLRGVLSGTLTYLFGEMERGVPFSRAVAAAVEAGYAEPDPRDDLAGTDVARKALILARAAGLAAEPADIAVESLVPPGLADVSRADVLRALASADDAWAARIAAAADAGRRLRYVATVESDGCRAAIRVGVEHVDASSALGQLTGTDNLVEISTDRYHASPMVVRGPGAGPDVTASAVLADVLDVARLRP